MIRSVGAGVMLGIAVFSFGVAQAGPLSFFPWNSSSADRQQAETSDRNGDHQAINLKCVATAPGLPVEGRNKLYCNTGQSGLYLSIDDADYALVLTNVSGQVQGRFPQSISAGSGQPTAALTLTDSANLYVVGCLDGDGCILTISTTSITRGRIITVEASTDNGLFIQAGTVKINGVWGGVTSDSITLQFDGTSWFEVSRRHGAAAAATAAGLNVPGAGKGTITIETITSDNINLNCLDSDGCDLTFSEKFASSYRNLTLQPIATSNDVTIADDSGVTVVTGASITLGPKDVVTFHYSADSEWVQSTAVLNN